MSTPLAEIFPDPLQSTFSTTLVPRVRTAIADGIWGPEDEASGGRDELLEYYFNYYTKETLSPRFSGVRYQRGGSDAANHIRTHKDLISFISLLKSSPQIARKAVKLMAKSDETLSTFDIDSALDLGVKIMLMISCISARNVVTTGHIFRPQWRDSETLEELLQRALPRHEYEPSAKPETIRTRNLRYAYVSAYAKVSIEWTDNLPDHLCLQITDEWKTLKLFKHVAVLELALQCATKDERRTSVVNSLNLGCIPAEIAAETLRTLRLLFPDDDLKSRAILKQEITNKSLDPRLSTSFQLHHGLDEYPGDASIPADLQALFAHYPYWGERLYKLLKEVEDPTPMTWYERWSDRRKAPRYTYWAGVIALALALFFGIASTVLGALQVWIGYCNMKGDATGCKTLQKGAS
jgi:hypothetical protein